MQSPYTTVEIPKWALAILNNIYEVYVKIELHGDSARIERNLGRMIDVLKDQGLTFEDPMGQNYDETRTDLEATISGESTEKLEVIEVIKPIIRLSVGPVSKVVQKGIVVVESKKKDF